MAETQNLENWLASIGLEKYADRFRDNAIDLDILSEIENADLAELGIPLGDRKRLLVSIKNMGGHHRVAEAVTATADALSDAEKFVERRQVTVLFCDLVGSTALSSRLDPEDLNAAIRSYQTACDDVVKQFDGYTGNYMGDGILAYFGWPVAHEEDAKRAIHAGFAMTEATRKIAAADGTVLATRVGIATGLVMVGELIGEGVAQQETVVGATPNIAAKIQSFAEAGNVVIADSTRELLGNTFELSDLGEYEVSGADSKVRVWNVDGIRAGASRFEVHSGSRRTPIVGRTEEIQRLTGFWQEASAGTAKFLQIVGEAGVGKSKLIQVFCDGLAQAPHRLIRLQCSSVHSNTAFYPIIEAIKSLLGLTREEAGAVVSTKLAAALKTAGTAAEPAASLIAAMLGLTAELPAEFQSLSPQLKREKTIDAAVDLLMSGSESVPLLVIVEDIHWIDPSTVDVLHELIERAKAHAALVVLTARTANALANWMDRADWEQMEIGTLSDEQALNLILQHTDGLSLPDDALSAILSHTDGVPLFVEELTKTVLESGQLRKTEAGYELKDSLPQLSIPTTLQASLSARLDQQPSAKPVAQAAATIGRSFSSDLLAHVAGISGEALEQQLEDLCRLGILSQQQDGNTLRYHFNHALVQDAAYQSQLKARRREIHAEIANALEGHYAGLPENRPEVLAHHLAQAGETERAVGSYLKAGQRAIHASAIKEAIAHLNSGLRLLRTLQASEARDLMEMRIQASIGTSLMLEKGWAAPEVQAAYARASELSDVAADGQEKLRILWGAWVSRQVRGRIFEAQALSDHIRIVAGQDGSGGSMLIADMISLQVAFYSGQFDSSIAYCNTTRELFRPDKHRALVDLYSTDLEVVAMVHQAIALYAVGHTSEALELRQLAEQKGRSIDHPYTLSWSLAWGATVAIFAADLQLARRLAQEALTIATAQGYDYVISLARFYLAYIQVLEGGTGDSLEQMRKRLDDFRSTGADIAVPHFLTLIASVLTQMGDAKQALALLDQAQSQVELYGEAWQESEIHRTRAEALQRLDGNRPEDVEASFQDAISLAVKQGASGWRWRAIVGQVEYMLSVGRQEAASSLLQEAISFHGNGAQCADYLRAKQIMLELQEATANPR